MDDENAGADVISIDSAKKPEEAIEDPKEKTTAELGMNPEQRQKWWENIFWKLTESPRFMKFIQANFVIGAIVDDEKKTAEPVVTQKENVPLDVSADQIFKIGVACMQSGAKDVKALTTRILGILGHKEAPQILPASEADLKRLSISDDIKKRLDP